MTNVQFPLVMLSRVIIIKKYFLLLEVLIQLFLRMDRLDIKTIKICNLICYCEYYNVRPNAVYYIMLYNNPIMFVHILFNRQNIIVNSLKSYSGTTIKCWILLKTFQYGTSKNSNFINGQVIINYYQLFHNPLRYYQN